MIEFKASEKQFIFKDDMKGRLMASRSLVSIIFVLGLAKLYLINWEQVETLDLVYIGIEVIFAYLLYKNFFIRTAKSFLNIEEISYFKNAEGLKTKAYFKLKNGKIRELYNLKTTSEKASLQQLVIKAGVKVI